jgi:acyl-CoA synthetase (AMP-forming)/AMP-acid ligase II
VNTAAGGAATILNALAHWSAHTPEAIALLAPERAATTYAELGAAVARLAADLRGLGLGRDDGIALAFPDGPEMHVALLAAMVAGIAVPLPWPLAQDEHAALLAHARVRVVVAHDAVAAPLRCDLPTIGWVEGASGRLSDAQICGAALGKPRPDDPPRADDVALILHSSGSTGSPKWIPRTHGAIVAACAAIIAARGKTPADRCLSLARAAYSQGINAWMYAVASGGSLISVRELDAAALPGWMATFRPTYISTGPTALRALAERDEAFAAMAPGSPLHSIHSTAGPLAAEEIACLEARFGVPILNGYGLTEAPGIAGEHFPRTVAVPGSVGKPWCDITMVDQRLCDAAAGEIGEIVVRGPTVFPGYLDDAAASAAVFLPGGWLRTGDLGFFDEPGYLHLTGRLGERINRGGEMIAPDEIDRVLRAHPAVAEAAAFGVPDGRLGEDIVVAVVLAPGADVTARALRRWLADRLSLHKVPRRIWFVSHLPRTRTGKVPRRALARAWGEMER